MKTIRVVAAIIRDKDKIFATQRGYGEFKDGWEFPGGKIEEGETPQDALKREIMEELDRCARQGFFLPPGQYGQKSPRRLRLSLYPRWQALFRLPVGQVSAFQPVRFWWRCCRPRRIAVRRRLYHIRLSTQSLFPGQGKRQRAFPPAQGKICRE